MLRKKSATDEVDSVNHFKTLIQKQSCLDRMKNKNECDLVNATADVEVH